MKVTITKLRQDLFRIMDQALEGEPVQFTHKGVVFRVVPEVVPDKLARLTRQTVVAPGIDVSQAGKELLQEMEAEWQADWAEL
jgi:hypothetical protein